MQIRERLRPWYGRKVIQSALLAAALVAAVIMLLTSTQDTIVNENVESSLPAVQLTTATEFAGGQSVSLVGNVRAFSEAAITAERSGQITSVSVNLGDTVAAGQIIATLENASERAAVLQAEGAYEAALASAEQSGISVSEAETTLLNAQKSAVSTYKSAYNTVNGVVRNSIDQFYSNPDATVPGLRIDGRGYTSFLNAERVAYQTLLPAWQSTAQTISIESDLLTDLEYAEESTQRTINVLDTFLAVLSQQENSNRYTSAELTGFRSEFTNLRETLIGVQTSIDNARSGLATAADSIRRAELGASGGTTSASDAQTKQALGSLRSAQASLSKTILRSPISGTVNSLAVRTGDFVNQSYQVAEVANNNALEIVTYISDSERDVLAVGDEVTIENEYTGVVTQIAPAVDAATRKIEVRIATENIDIQNGDTVRVSKTVSDTNIDAIFVPLAAVKFSVDTGVMFTVENNELVERTVTIGKIRGGSVEITNGLSAAEAFVVDARGLQAGQAVEVIE